MAGKGAIKIPDPLPHFDTLRRRLIDSKQEADCSKKEPGKKSTGHVIKCRKHHHEAFLEGKIKKSSKAMTCGSENDDYIAMREDYNAFHNIWFRPRVLVNVEELDTSTTMFGKRVDMPYYMTTALGLPGDSKNEAISGECTTTHNIIEMISAPVPCSFDKILDATEGGKMQWLHLYVNGDREATKRIVQHAEKRGYSVLVITIDTVQLGYQEEHALSKCSATCPDEQKASEQGMDQDHVTTRPISSFVNVRLSWEDITWILNLTKMSLVLRGLQSTEDIMRAVEFGIHGIILSGHSRGHPNLARSTIEVLADVMPILRERKCQHKIEVYIESNTLRAADIIKALCLGARGVGISHPFQHSISAYGLRGVDRAMQSLKNEMELAMRLIGASKISDLNTALVSVRGLSTPVSPMLGSALSGSVLDSFARSKKAKL